MVKMSEELRASYDKWLDFIVKEIDRIKMDNIAKVNEILTLRNVIRALRNVIRENKDILDAIKVQIRTSPDEMPDIEREVDNARDYAAYVLDMIDKIEGYNSDEGKDDEPVAYYYNPNEVI